MNFLAWAGQGIKSLINWWWRRTRTDWQQAWNAPARELRLAYLFLGLLIAWYLIPDAFKSIGVMGGISYLLTLFIALSNATFFKIVKIRRAEYIPLGPIAPIIMFCGVAGSKAVNSLLGEAKDAALAGDFAGALIVLTVFAGFTLFFNRWKSGNPYSDNSLHTNVRRRR